MSARRSTGSSPRRASWHRGQRLRRCEPGRRQRDEFVVARHPAHALGFPIGAGLDNAFTAAGDEVPPQIVPDPTDCPSTLIAPCTAYSAISSASGGRAEVIEEDKRPDAAPACSRQQAAHSKAAAQVLFPAFQMELNCHVDLSLQVEHQHFGPLARAQGELRLLLELGGVSGGKTRAVHVQFAAHHMNVGLASAVKCMSGGFAPVE